MQRQTREIRLQKSQTQCMCKYPSIARDKISFGTCDTLLQKLYKTKFSQVWEDKHIRYLKRFTLHRIQRSDLIIFQGVRRFEKILYLIVWIILIEMILYITIYINFASGISRVGDSAVVLILLSIWHHSSLQYDYLE